MLFSNSKNNDCGCKGGSGSGSGSGYGIGNSSPLLLGPKTGYGRLDPYRPDAVDSGGLKFPPLLGGNKNINKYSIFNHNHHKYKSKNKIKSKRHNNKRQHNICKHTKQQRHFENNKNHKHTKTCHKHCLQKSSLHKTKKKLKMKGGGSLSYSDFSPSSASNLSDGKQLASSPMYATGSINLSANESALANPPPTSNSNQCKN